jgi:hypothetical protein
MVDSWNLTRCVILDGFSLLARFFKLGVFASSGSLFSNGCLPFSWLAGARLVVSEPLAHFGQMDGSWRMARSIPLVGWRVMAHSPRLVGFM